MQNDRARDALAAVVAAVVKGDERSIRSFCEVCEARLRTNLFRNELVPEEMATKPLVYAFEIPPSWFVDGAVLLIGRKLERVSEQIQKDIEGLGLGPYVCLFRGLSRDTGNVHLEFLVHVTPAPLPSPANTPKERALPTQLKLFLMSDPELHPDSYGKNYTDSYDAFVVCAESPRRAVEIIKASGGAGAWINTPNIMLVGQAIPALREGIVLGSWSSTG